MPKKDKANPRRDTTPKGKAQRKPKATSLYPKYSLVEALKLAESIRDNNAGQPYNRVDLAASLETSPESSSFRILITASSRYGLTEGGYQAERISLTELGRSIVSPTSDEERAAALLRALYNVEFYKSFFSKYQNHRLPRKDLLLNTLEREFKIPAGDREQCYDLLIKNATELGLLKDVSGTPYVRFDQPSLTAGDKESDASVSDNGGATGEDGATQGLTPSVVVLPAPEQLIQPPTDAATTHKPRIFISHSKNTKILGQIKSNLEFGGFSYKIATMSSFNFIPQPSFRFIPHFFHVKF